MLGAWRRRAYSNGNQRAHGRVEAAGQWKVTCSKPMWCMGHHEKARPGLCVPPGVLVTCQRLGLSRARLPAGDFPCTCLCSFQKSHWREKRRKDASSYCTSWASGRVSLESGSTAEQRPANVAKGRGRKCRGRSHSFSPMLVNTGVVGGHLRARLDFLTLRLDHVHLLTCQSLSFAHRRRWGRVGEGRGQWRGCSSQGPHTSPLSCSPKHCPLLFCAFFWRENVGDSTVLGFVLWNGL